MISLCFPFALQYRVVVPKLGTVTDLCSALSKLCGFPPENVRTSYFYTTKLKWLLYLQLDIFVVLL